MTNLLSDLDLAALLCSRVCHDLVSPVGAIANGLEMMDEEDDQELHRLALELVRRSARQASAKLQFCRLAFGAAGGAGSLLDVGEAGDIARLFVAEEKVKLDWLAPRGARDKNEVKLLLNLMLLAIAAVPRGGNVAIEATERASVGNRSRRGGAAGRQDEGRARPRRSGGRVRCPRRSGLLCPAPRRAGRLHACGRGKDRHGDFPRREAIAGLTAYCPLAPG